MIPLRLFGRLMSCALLIAPFTASAQSLSPSGYAFGSAQVCQLQDDGQVACTVRDGSRRLLPPNDLPPLTTLTLGEAHACGITVDAQAVCWGDNDFGQLNVPEIDGDLVQIDAGQNHTCALDASGEAFCWGLNNNRQTEPPEGERFQQLELATDASCGIRDTGEISCWTNSQVFVTRNFTDPFSGPFSDIDINNGSFCALNEQGSIICSSSSFAFTDGPYTDIAVTFGAQCGVDQESTLQCLTGTGSVPALFPVGEQFQSIHGIETDRFGSAMCGERLDGSLQCWGENSGSIPLPGLDGSFSPSDTRTSVALELDARIYGSNAVEIFWASIVGIGSPQLEVEIFRNGEFLDRVGSRFSYFDSNALIDNNYQVQLVDDQGNTGPLSAVLSINTELGTVLFDGEPPITSSSFVAPANQSLITDTLFQSLFNASGGFIVSWTVDQDLASTNDLAGYEVLVGGESAGFTRSRLFVQTDGALSGRCIEIIAVDSNGSILDSAAVSSSGCR